MNINNLLEALEKIDFSQIDCDEVLHARDIEVFDNEWMRVYDEIENMKTEKNYTTDQKKKSDDVRERCFKKVYKLSDNGEISGYISDDFGLIIDSEIVGYTDKWLNKLIESYRNFVVPSGRL